jgi:hypothetical protein
MLAALAPLGKRETTRQRLRDLLRAGADTRVLCPCDWGMTLCVAPLLRWLLSWWQGKEIALALAWYVLSALLAPAPPAAMAVVVCTDRSVWSPRLWRAIRACGWHPIMRIRADCTVAPTGSRRLARLLVPGPGHVWVGTGITFKPEKRQAGCSPHRGLLPPRL